MNKIEQKFQTAFGKWINATSKGKSQAKGYELKQTKNKRLLWSAVKDHQLQGLIVDRDIGRHHKYPDVGYTRYPYDSTFIRILEGYIVIKYRSQEKGNTEFVMVDVDEFINEKTKSSEASLHEDRAIAIGELKDLNII